MSSFISNQDEQWPEIKKVFDEKRYEIHLNGNDINKRLERLHFKLPNDLFKLNHLNFMELIKTSLEQIPSEIGDLVNLNQLILHSNKLKELPQSIGKLVKLQHLDLSHNQLVKLPFEMKNLTELMTLNLSFNKLNDLFASFHALNKLAVLNLSNNQFKSLPNDLFHTNLSNLSDLDCSFNEIVFLNENIFELESLKVFNLENNHIEHVPSSISKSLKLKELLLKSNKLKDNRLRKLIDANKLKAVLEYLERQYEEECKKQVVKNSSIKNNQKAILNCEHEIVIRSFSDTTSKQVFYDESVTCVRPFIVCCIVRGINLKQEGNFKTFLNLQTKLHENVCEKRTQATIATHDLKLINGNLIYEANDGHHIQIVPLGRASETSASEFYDKLYQEAEAERKAKKRNQLSGIYKYLSLLDASSSFPYLKDSENNILSLPPLTNSDKTRMSVDTEDIFIEITSTISFDVCKKIMHDLIVEMLKCNLFRKEAQMDSLSLDSFKINSIMHIDQVKIVDSKNNLKCIYPSKVDLQLNDNLLIKVSRF